ncbi:fasciclin-3-like [Homalodisca vitripennis]|uniref:fasciclin-3-like n=1 Tax=Homalodisca vitripennis TaxID=197043 RepID=UPI001EEA246D|nr:fasciclin-3-like [Homalodisca vitripennis]
MEWSLFQANNLKPISVIFVVLFCHLQGTWCLSKVHLHVPAAVMSGDDLTLDCTYTLSHEKINSIKYFLGGEEIYEYNPNKNPKYKTYIVNLGTNLWGNQSMTLRKVNGKYTGLYKCSILTDSIVDAEEDSGSVTVVDKPLEAPKIDVEENGFQVGKVLKANCTSIGGYPPANLTWLVNGEKVASNGISGPKQYVEDGEVDISVSELMLPIMIAPRSGHIKLTCTATQYTLYSVSTDLQVDLKEVTVSSSTKLMNMFLGVMKGKGNVFISAVMASSIYLLHIIH